MTGCVLVEDSADEVAIQLTQIGPSDAGRWVPGRRNWIAGGVHGLVVAVDPGEDERDGVEASGRYQLDFQVAEIRGFYVQSHRQVADGETCRKADGVRVSGRDGEVRDRCGSWGTWWSSSESEVERGSRAGAACDVDRIGRRNDVFSGRGYGNGIDDVKGVSESRASGGSSCCVCYTKCAARGAAY